MLDLGLERPRRVRRPLPHDRRDRRPARGDRRLRDAVPRARADLLGRAHLRDRSRLRRRLDAVLVRAGPARTRAPARSCRSPIRRRSPTPSAATSKSRTRSPPPAPRHGGSARSSRGRRLPRRPRRCCERPSSSRPGAAGRSAVDLQLVEPANRSPAHARRRRRHRAARERGDPEPRRAATASTTSPGSRSSRSSSPAAATSRSGRRSSTARSRSSRTRPSRRRGHAELHGLRPPLARRAAPRRPRRPHGVGARRDPLDGMGARRRRADRAPPRRDRSRRSPANASLRTGAYAALGLARLDADRLDREARQLLERVDRAAGGGLQPHCADDGWRWFEDALTYDNARLPHALIVGGATLGRDELVGDGPRGAPLARRRVRPRRGPAAPDRARRPAPQRARAGRR